MWTRKPSPTNPQGQQQHKPRSNLQIKSETVPAQRHNLDAERHPVPEINPPASRRALGEIIPESPRDIISESWAASSRSTRAASSESAGRGGSHPRELPPFAPASDDRNNALAHRHGRDLLELALAHKIAGKTESAYQRDDLLDQRRPIMDAWARFLGERIAENVYRFPA